MIELQDQAYYIPGLTRDLCIIYQQGITTSQGYKCTFKFHSHDEHDNYDELNLKENNPGWKKAKTVERL